MRRKRSTCELRIANCGFLSSSCRFRRLCSPRGFIYLMNTSLCEFYYPCIFTISQTPFSSHFLCLLTLFQFQNLQTRENCETHPSLLTVDFIWKYTIQPTFWFLSIQFQDLTEKEKKTQPKTLNSYLSEKNKDFEVYLELCYPTRRRWSRI